MLLLIYAFFLLPISASQIPSTSTWPQASTVLKTVGNLGTYRRLTDQQETLIVSAGVAVAAGSVLTLDRVHIIADSGFTAAAFIVEGQLVLTECVIENFESAVFSVTGEVIVTNSTFRNNRGAAFIMFNAAKVRLFQVEVNSHTGTFLLYRGSDQLGISIEDSTFSNGIQSGNEAVVLLSTYGGAGSASFSRCTFTSNRLRLLLFDVHSTAVSVRDCNFLFNSGTLLTFYQSGGYTEVQSCQFLNNLNTILSVYALRGGFFVSDVQISNHTSPMFFRIENRGSSSDCIAEFNNILITDSFTQFNVSSSSVLSVSACTVFAEHFTINNTMLYARLNSQFVALFVVQGGALHLSNSSAVNSGSSGTLMAVLFSTAICFHCIFLNSTVLQSIAFGLLLAEMEFEGIEIEDLRKGSYVNDFKLEAVYFGLSQSRMKGTNLSVVHSNLFKSTAIFAPRFSSFSLRNVNLTNVSTSVGISTVNSSGDITSFKATGCIFSYFVYQTVSNSELTITGTEINNSVFRQKTGGVLSLCTKSHVILFDLSIMGTKVTYIAKAKNSHLEVYGIFASKCTFKHLLRDVVNSQLLISGLQFVNSVGGLADTYNCNVTFTDSVIETVSASDFLIRTSATAIELRNVTVTNVTVGKSIAYLQDASTITLIRLSVSAIRTLQDQGFVTNGGNIVISDSKFFSFAGSLIQAYGSMVSITSTSFSNGHNLIQSRISQLAYGGVLGCIDCVAVHIINVNVRNVSTVYGGAISIRSAGSNREAVFVVRQSTFESCRAAVGGALYIRNVNFDIDESTFYRNSAEESGGAIDVSIPIHFTKSLRNLVFVNNHANEGGAVKWHNAQVLLQNISVANNSAQYGPDFASYGIELSSRLTGFSNFIASGYPLHLIYEIVDHYGQRVTSSREEMLILNDSDSISFPGYTTVVKSRGLFNFTVPMVLAPPGSTQLLIARIDIMEAGAVVERRAIAFRKCVPGEVEQIDRCAYCFSGRVSFHPKSGECSLCPKHALCFGGMNMTVDSNYWRSSNDSFVLVECPMLGTCLGGSDNSCAYGFTGKLCNECIDGFYRYQMTGCEQCDEGAALYAQLLPAMTVVVLIFFLIIKCSVSETRLFTLKTAFSHAQLLSAMSPMKGNLPWSFRGFLHGLSYFSSFFTIDLPLSCMGVRNESVVRAVVASCLLPFFFALATLIFIVHPKKQVVVCYTSLLLFVPTIVIQSLLPLLACVSGDDGRRWLFTDMSQECWNMTHHRLFYRLFIPSICVSVLTPMLLAASTALYLPKSFVEYFPMWTCGYRWAPWDVVQYVLKNSLQILMYSGLGFSRMEQFAYGLVALYVLCFANVFFATRVYNGKESFWLAECSFLIVTLCYSMGGLYVFKETGYSGSTVTFSIAFVSLNCGFLICCAYCLLWDFKETRFTNEHVGTENQISASGHHLQAESFGEAIVPNNSQFVDTPTRVLAQESV